MHGGDHAVTVTHAIGAVVNGTRQFLQTVPAGLTKEEIMWVLAHPALLGSSRYAMEIRQCSSRQDQGITTREFGFLASLRGVGLFFMGTKIVVQKNKTTEQDYFQVRLLNEIFFPSSPATTLGVSLALRFIVFVCAETLVPISNGLRRIKWEGVEE